MEGEGGGVSYGTGECGDIYLSSVYVLCVRLRVLEVETKVGIYHCCFRKFGKDKEARENWVVESVWKKE